MAGCLLDVALLYVFINLYDQILNVLFGASKKASNYQRRDFGYGSITFEMNLSSAMEFPFMMLLLIPFIIR